MCRPKWASLDAWEKVTIGAFTSIGKGRKGRGAEKRRELTGGGNMGEYLRK